MGSFHGSYLNLCHFRQNPATTSIHSNPTCVDGAASMSVALFFLFSGCAQLPGTSSCRYTLANTRCSSCREKDGVTYSLSDKWTSCAPKGKTQDSKASI